MTFKVGDRVELYKNYSYIPNVGLTGTILKISKNSIENQYQVLWDNGIVDDGCETFEGEIRVTSKLHKAMK